MNRNEYQEAAAAFVIYKPELAMHYLLPGLRCEADEFLQAYTGRTGFYAKELGDIAWFCASILREFGLPMPDMPFPEHARVNVSHVDRLVMHSRVVLDLWVKRVRDAGGVLTTDHRDIIVTQVTDIYELVLMFTAWYGYSEEQLLQANIEKLKSRMERGVISGSGDNR